LRGTPKASRAAVTAERAVLAGLAAGCSAPIGAYAAGAETLRLDAVVVAANDAEARAALDRIPPERRPHVAVGTPEQMADALRPYLDAGFTGFTFNNNIYRTPEAIGVIGELLRLVAGAEPVLARAGT